MQNYYDFQDTNKNAAIDLIKKYLSQDVVTMDEVIATIATPFTRLDFNLSQNQGKKMLVDLLVWFVRGTKKHFDIYDKDGLYDLLLNDWVSTLSEDEKTQMLAEFKLVDSFREDGGVVLSEKLYNTYVDLCDKGYTQIVYAPLHEKKGARGSISVKPIGEGPFRTLVATLSNGYYDVETVMTADHWRQVIEHLTEKQRMYVALFLEMPGYRGSCHEVSKKFGVREFAVNMLNTTIGMKAKNMMGNFTVVDCDKMEEDRYWSIAMNHGRHEEGGFAWTMRPELVEAALEAKAKGLLPDVGKGLSNSELEEKA